MSSVFRCLSIFYQQDCSLLQPRVGMVCCTKRERWIRDHTYLSGVISNTYGDWQWTSANRYPMTLKHRHLDAHVHVVTVLLPLLYLECFSSGFQCTPKWLAQYCGNCSTGRTWPRRPLMRIVLYQVCDGFNQDSGRGLNVFRMTSFFKSLIHCSSFIR